MSGREWSFAKKKMHRMSRRSARQDVDRVAVGSVEVGASRGAEISSVRPCRQNHDEEFEEAGKCLIGIEPMIGALQGAGKSRRR
jgi:hypothetical protein